MTDQLSLQTLIDRATISDQVYRYTKGLDTRDWELVASVFTDPFHLVAEMLDVDRTVTPKEYLALGPQTFLPGFDATAHINTNQLITLDGDHAHIETKMYACHYINQERGRSSRRVIGAGRPHSLQYANALGGLVDTSIRRELAFPQVSHGCGRQRGRYERDAGFPVSRQALKQFFNP